MTSSATPMKFGRVLAAGLSVHVIAQLVLVFLIVLSADPLLGFAAQNPVEAVRIGHLFGPAAFWALPAITALLTFSAAALVGQSVAPSAASLHGLLVGLIAALVSLAFGGLDLTAIAGCLLLLAAGRLGGRLGGQIAMRHA